MSTRGERAPGRATRRLAVTAAVSASILLISMAGAVAAVRPGAPSAAALRSADVSALAGSGSPAQQAQPAQPVPGEVSWGAGGLAFSTLTGSVPVMLTMLTAYERHACPATAAACVDLTRDITWLQADGRVTFGPVQMEPGPPGTAHATPTGTFHVSWKTGPDFVSSIYNEPMPWAVFFAPGGIAFHGGSLTRWSHGCVHLTTADAHYYNEHLPIGAEVVVF
jgi:hypothetical protein